MIYNYRMKFKRACVAAALCAALPLPVALTACVGVGNNSGSGGDKSGSYTQTYYAMDTAARLAVAGVNKEDFEKLSQSVESFLSAAENSLSAARTNSCVYKFNAAPAGTTVEIDQICYEALTVAQTLYESTSGYFNPAVYYCEDIYGFAARPAGAPAMPYDRMAGDAPTLPDEKYVAAFKELSSHFSEVVLSQSDGKYYAFKPNFTVSVEGDENAYSLAIDLGGIAKGWCVDKVNEMLDDAGVAYGYFNFGTSSMGVKKYSGGDGYYTVSTGDPRNEDASYMTFKVQDACFSTSADSRNFYEIDGTRYCHVIDPTTGRPVRTGVASATVVGGTAAQADAFTTAIMAMGEERAVEFINGGYSHLNVAMLIIGGDGAGRIVTNAPTYFTAENNNYQFISAVFGD